jgi:hypothetical protein
VIDLHSTHPGSKDKEMKLLRLLTIASTIILVGFSSCTQKKLENLIYPDQVKHTISSYTEIAERIFSNTSPLLFKTPPSIEARSDGIFIDLVIDNPTNKEITFAGRGEPLSYGGVIPLSLYFAESSRKKLTYTGGTQLPAPPPPVIITIPARSSVTFKQSLSLRDYTYSGTPGVEVKWSFQFVSGRDHDGILSIILPAKRNDTTQPLSNHQLALISDIDTLCRRVKTGRISMWSQPVYQTDRWRKLTDRADSSDPKAFCEMADLMKEYTDKLSCQESFRKELQSRCNR